MSKSLMILFAILAVANVASADTKNLTFGFYENQDRFLPIESLTGTSGCTYNFGSLDVVDVNKTWPHYVSSQNLVRVGFDAIKPSEIVIKSMNTVCGNGACSIYVIDDKQALYKRFGRITPNGTWVFEGDSRMSDAEILKDDKFLSVSASADQTFAVSLTTKNTTRFILGLKPEDGQFTPNNTMFEVQGALPDSDIEYFQHEERFRSFLVLEKGKDVNALNVIYFEEKPAAQTPYTFTVNATALGLKTIYAIEADAFVPQVLYMFADSSLLAYNVSNSTNWTLLGKTDVTVANPGTGTNILERKKDFLILACQGDNSLTVFDVPNPQTITQKGSLKVESTERMEIDFSEKLSYAYITRPVADKPNTTLLTIYDLKLLKGSSSASNARRFEGTFTNAAYSNITDLSVNNFDDNSDMLFWFGVQGDIYKFYDKAGIMIEAGSDAEILNDSSLVPGPRPGSYVYSYEFTATPFCAEVAQPIIINITLNFILPLRTITKNATQENQKFTEIYPGVLFNGPVETILAKKNPTDKYAGNYTLEIVEPLSIKSNIMKLFNPKSDILVEQFTDFGRAFLLIRTLDDTTPGADSYKIINVNLTRGADELDYALDRSAEAWGTVKTCHDLMALKDGNGSLAFVVFCSIEGKDKQVRLFTYFNVSTDDSNGTITLVANSTQDVFKSITGFDSDDNKNVLFQIYDSDENGGVFADSTFVPLPGLSEDPKYSIKYSDIAGPDGKTLSGQVSIIGYDVVAFENEKTFKYAISAITADHKLIVSYLGGDAPSSVYFDLEASPIFKTDKLFESPFFSKVQWINDDCSTSKTHGNAALLLISPNFYSYRVRIAMNGATPTLNILNGFSYFPTYHAVDGTYDTCTNTFITLNNFAADPTPEPSCFMMVYPGNATNASSFTFTGSSYPILEPIILRSLPCPTLLRAETLGNDRIDNITAVSFAYEGNIASVLASLSYGIKITNNTLPSNMDADGLLIDIEAYNQFSASKVGVVYPVSKIAPGPGPGPGPAPGPDPKKGSNLTWLWILLGIVGVILIIAAVVWVLRNKKEGDEPLLDGPAGKQDMSLQNA